MSYTIKNLREVEDSAVKGGFSETQEARFAAGDLDAQDTGLSHHIVKAGKRHAFGHRHHEAEEIYVVVAGSGRVKLDDEIADLAPMDAVRVAPQVTRAFEAGPEDLELVAFGPHHKGHAEIVKGFWAD